MTPDGLSAAIVAALGRLVAEGRLRLTGDLPGDVKVVRPRRSGHGDLSCGVALQLAGISDLPARELAGLLAERLGSLPDVASAEVGGPGFLNVRLPPVTPALAERIVALGPSYGRGREMAGERVVLGMPAAAPARTDLGAGRLAAVAEATAGVATTCGAGVTWVECSPVAAAAGPVMVRGTGAPWPAAGPLGPVRTVDDLVGRVGADVARYALVRRPVHAPLDLDLDVWARAGVESPAYAVRLAHARLVSVLRAAEALVLRPPGPTPTGPAVHSSAAGSALLRELADFPQVVLQAARRREPHRVARHLEEVTGLLDDLDRPLLPVGDVVPGPADASRLLLAAATRVVLANGLALLGVPAPDRM